MSSNLLIRIMVKNFLLTLLLLAIAFSQIFGGIACCCFMRTVSVHIGGLYGASIFDTTISAVNEQNVVVKSVDSPCPKCVAQAKKSTDKKADLTSKDIVKVNEPAAIDAPCSCSKYLCVSSDQNELPSINTKIGGAQWIAAEFPRQSTTNRPLTIQSGLPPLLVLGKHSWQSLACIWKN
jgi:hypothetical protein